jgi:hypothetical protein
MINFNTDKIFFVYFPGGAGGHFVLTALALSDNVAFTKCDLIKRKLNDDFTLADKVTYLHNELDLAIDTKKWNDFGLDAFYFFEKDNLNTTLLRELTNKSIYIGGCACIEDHINNLILTWKNASIINFINHSNFINWRKNGDYSIGEYWDKIRGNHWPIDPPTSESEFLRLPKFIIDELETKFCGEIHRFLTDTAILSDSNFPNRSIVYSKTSEVINLPTNTNNKILKWDCNWFFSKSQTINGLKNLYKDLNFDDFNETAVADYYQHWISTITVLKKSINK